MVIQNPHIQLKQRLTFDVCMPVDAMFDEKKNCSGKSIKHKIETKRKHVDKGMRY